jgi:hypothetical protein
MKLTLAKWLATVLILAVLPAVHADEAEKPADEQRAAHLARMKKLAGSIRLLSNPRRPDSTVKLLPDPVLRYGDNTRQNDEATLWIWSGGGRPSAILAVEYYAKSTKGVGGPQWLFEIASLSTQPIAAEHEKDLRWTGKGPGLVFTRLDDADPVIDKATRRLAQMKEIFRRFTAHEKEGTSGRIELRPLASPLHRYSAPDQNIVDGAIFALCNGTNPEVLVILEAQSRDDAAAAWHYALVQMTGGIVVAKLDDKQVWERGEADPPAVRDNYVNGWFAADKDK